MLMWWFPGELFFIDGGWQGLKIVALIDLVLGPMLTLVLYKPGKPSLVFDMSCVAAFQILALAYGFYATYHQRTVAVVFADRNFTTLSAGAASVAKAELIKLQHTPQSIKAIDDAYPAMLLTPEPGPGKFGEYVSKLFNGYPESHERLDLFVKLGQEHTELLSRLAATQEKLETTGADKIITEAIEDGNFDATDIDVHFFKARYAQGLVLFSKSEQKILDYVPVPWDELIAKKEAELADESNPGANTNETTDVSDNKNLSDTQNLSDTESPSKTNPGVIAESLEQ